LTYANIFKKIFKKQSEGSAAYEIQNSQFKILSPKGHDYLQSKSSEFLALKGTII